MDNTSQLALLSVKKSSGTLAKVTKMIENEEYCIDIIQQVDAAIGLLKSAKKQLLTGHLNNCVEHKLKEDKPKAVSELVRIFDLAK